MHLFIEELASPRTSPAPKFVAVGSSSDMRVHYSSGEPMQRLLLQVAMAGAVARAQPACDPDPCLNGGVCVHVRIPLSLPRSLAPSLPRSL